MTSNPSYEQTGYIKYRGYAIKEGGLCVSVYSYSHKSKSYCLIEYVGINVEDCKKWIDNEIEYGYKMTSYFYYSCCHTDAERDAVRRLIRSKLGKNADEQSYDNSHGSDPDNTFDDVLYRVSYEVEIDLQYGYDESSKDRIYTNKQLITASNWVRKYRSLGTPDATICQLY